MSSNIKVERICEWGGKKFTAQTTGYPLLLKAVLRTFLQGTDASKKDGSFQSGNLPISPDKTQG